MCFDKLLRMWKILRNLHHLPRVFLLPVLLASILSLHFQDAVPAASNWILYCWTIYEFTYFASTCSVCVTVVRPKFHSALSCHKQAHNCACLTLHLFWIGLNLRPMTVLFYVFSIRDQRSIAIQFQFTIANTAMSSKTARHLAKHIGLEFRAVENIIKNDDPQLQTDCRCP